LAASVHQGSADAKEARATTKENLVTARRLVRPRNPVSFGSRAKPRASALVLGPLALVLLSVLLALPALAQDLGESPPSGGSSDIDNEMPPGDPPKPPPAEVMVEKPVEGSIKDISEKRRPYGVSLDAYLPWLGGFGGGFKVSAEIPIMHNGFIPSINDSFSLEPRFMFSYQSWTSFAARDDLYVMGFTPAAAAVWSFYFKTNLRVYAFVALGYTIVKAANIDVTGLSHRFYHDVGPGMYWDFAQHWSLRAELGYSGMRLGITYLI
jgi:hypothetical protein